MMQGFPPVEPPPTVIGVVGDANVGKSTLLNALVFGDQSILPSAGVGSVTARATRLRHACTARLGIHYVQHSYIYELCYALEHLDAASGGRRVVESEYPDLGGDTRIALRAAASAELSARARREAQTRPQISRIASHVRMLLVGDPDSGVPLRILRKSMRALVGLSWESDSQLVLEPELVFRIRQRIRSGRAHFETSIDLDDVAWRHQLAAHVTGALSVLTAEISIGWPSTLLGQGLELIDLPGLGVASDAHKLATWSWLAESCENLLLVCMRSGVSDACQEALVSSGALARLIQAWDIRRCPLTLVVTHLDDEARQLRRNHRRGRLLDHFAGLSTDIEPVLRGQLSRLLQVAAPYLSGKDAARLATSVPVLSVAAPAYLSLRGRDDELQSFFKDPEQTNIPRLARILGALGCRGTVPGPDEAVRSLALHASMSQEP